MQIQFYKYQGTGNDFVMIDNRKGIFDPGDLELVRQLCDRKFGIGADGLILIQNHKDYDFEVVYFNADGSKSLCGNGSRCAVLFANFLQIIESNTTFLAIDGAHKAFIKDGLIHLKMNDVLQINKSSDDFYLNTGSPHYVRFVKDVKSIDVFAEGKEIRNSDKFRKEGINVNFAEKVDDGKIFVRTYERGVENETLSCGTGVTACALVTTYLGMHSPVKVQTLGGELSISFDKKEEYEFENIYLIGPAKRVFQGEIDTEVALAASQKSSKVAI